MHPLSFATSSSWSSSSTRVSHSLFRAARSLVRRLAVRADAGFPGPSGTSAYASFALGSSRKRSWLIFRRVRKAISASMPSVACMCAFAFSKHAARTCAACCRTGRGIHKIVWPPTSGRRRSCASRRMRAGSSAEAPAGCPGGRAGVIGVAGSGSLVATLPSCVGLLGRVGWSKIRGRGVRGARVVRQLGQ